jgi:CRP-like cAMP-binding protein/CheY-like chemotaxis protein
MKKHPAEVASDFKDYPFFKSFSENLILQIATMADVKNFKSGEFILLEGQQNSLLYFLNKGQVDVRLKGELLVQLDRKGEVLGEMSVISHLPVSTDIRALSNVECYTLNTQDLSVVPVKDRDLVQTLLYRIFADILTDRLRTTNNKARQFEITNRDLIKAQEDLKSINHSLEDQVHERTKDLLFKTEQLEKTRDQLEKHNMVLSTGFKKLADANANREKSLKLVEGLLDLHIKPVAKYLASLSKSSAQDSSVQELIVQIRNEHVQLEKKVTHLNQLFQSEATGESHRVLLLEPEKKQQIVAKMALGGTGVKLDVAQDIEVGKALLQENSYDLIFCEITMGEVLLKARELNFAGEMVLVNPHALKDSLQNIKSLDFVDNLISRDPEDRTFNVKSIVTTVTKILNRDYYGLEKYLGWGVEIHKLDLKRSDQRNEAIEEMQNQLKSLGVRGTLLERCAIVAEEMLMNAIYDAPVDQSGKHLFNHLPRTEKVNWEQNLPGLSSQLQFACDGNLVAVAVVDPFGSLPKKILIEYLEKNYMSAIENVNANQNKGGAGRGLHQIIENSDLTIFNVRKGFKTEAIALFNIDVNKDKIKEPSLSYFFR